MEERYSRSVGSLTESGVRKLKRSRVAVAGCGGLGGYILEMLSREGVGTLTAIDGDAFDETNLNRQLLAEEANLGTPKVQAAVARIGRINPSVAVRPVHQWITKDNVMHLLKGHDLVADALDSIAARFLLQEACGELGIPMVHGAIGGWYGQVTVIHPGDRTLDKLYPSSQNKGIESRLGNPSFTPALIASLQVAEAIKLLIGKGEPLRNRVLRVDLLEQEYTVLEL